MTKWRTLPDYPDYHISDVGEVRRNGYILKPRPNNSGYLRVSLCRHGIVRDRYIHRLVCEVFHGPCPTDDMQVRHLDGNRTNNAAANLVWATRAENEADKIAHGTLPIGERHGSATLNERIVIEARRRASGGELISEIARDIGVNAQTLYQAVRGLSWGHLPGAARSDFHKKWTVEEIMALRCMAADGKSLSFAADSLGRSYDSAKGATLRYGIEFRDAQGQRPTWRAHHSPEHFEQARKVMD
jgi:hypothetical protein